MSAYTTKVKGLKNRKMHECAARNMEKWASKHLWANRISVNSWGHSHIAKSKFLLCAVCKLQIAYPQICMIIPQMANPQISTKKLHYSASNLLGEKACIYGLVKVLIRQIRKKIRSENVSHLWKVRKCYKLFKFAKFVELRSANRPPLRRYKSSLGRMLFSASPPPLLQQLALKQIN